MLLNITDKVLVSCPPCRSPYSLMDKVMVFGTIDGGSIPSKGTNCVYPDYIEGPVAQLAEHLPLKEVVESSSLSRLTLYCHNNLNS